MGETLGQKKEENNHCPKKNYNRIIIGQVWKPVVYLEFLQLREKWSAPQSPSPLALKYIPIWHLVCQDRFSREASAF